MSSPAPTTDAEIWLLLVGAVLAIIGGYVGDEVRAWRERLRECKAMKISLADELQEVESTIGNMHQVWEQAQLLPAAYVTTLLQSTSAYDNLRPRLFLIKNKDLRKEISDFYKKLKDLALKADGKLGTLSTNQEATSEQAGFDASFQALAAEARTLRGKLD